MSLCLLLLLSRGPLNLVNSDVIHCSEGYHTAYFTSPPPHTLRGVDTSDSQL